MFRGRMEIHRELPNGVAAIGEEGKLLIRLHALRLQDFEVMVSTTTPMPYLTRASEAGTLRISSTIAVGSPSTEEHDTDATHLYL
jgi:hypothetical protein